MATKAEIFDLGYQLSEAATPPECSGCNKPDKLAFGLAAKILDGELCRTDAVVSLIKDLSANCPGGLKEIEGICFGNSTECSYLEESNEIVN